MKEVAVSFVRRLPVEEKPCPVCNKKFEGVKKRTYCSRTCQAKADYDRNVETYRAHRREVYRAAKQQQQEQ